MVSLQVEEDGILSVKKVSKDTTKQWTASFQEEVDDVPTNVGIIAEKTCSTIYIGPSELHASRYNLRHVL